MNSKWGQAHCISIFSRITYESWALNWSLKHKVRNKEFVRNLPFIGHYKCIQRGWQPCEMLNSPQHILTGGLASNYPHAFTHQQGTQQHTPYSSAYTMMQQGSPGAGFGMVARAALMPTPSNGVNGTGGHPPHPHHPVSLGLEVRLARFLLMKIRLWAKMKRDKVNQYLFHVHFTL